MKALKAIFAIVVIIIGFVMMIRYSGVILPPVLSGIAFALIGVIQLMNLKK